jgi:hypothetical protein
MFSELPKSPQAFYTDILVQSIIALKLMPRTRGVAREIHVLR